MCDYIDYIYGIEGTYLKLSNTGGLVLTPCCRQRGRKSAYANLQGAEVKDRCKYVTSKQ